MTAIAAQAIRSIAGTRRRGKAASGEIEASKVMGGAQLIGCRVGGDAAEGEDVGAVRELEGERRLLLDQENGEAAAVELAEGFQDLGGDARRPAQGRLRRQPGRGGRP